MVSRYIFIGANTFWYIAKTDLEEYMKITKNQARNFLVRYHHLTTDTALSGKDGILQFINKVGCVQFDPLNVVGRNADLVLQSRVVDYREEMLYELLYTDRALIDGWDKMMAIYSARDWSNFKRVRECMACGVIGMLKHRGSQDALNYIDTVLDFVAKNGVSAPKDIKLGQMSSGTWGHKSIAGAALDYLWHSGKVGVFAKANANKVYDLIEKLLPTEILNTPDPFATNDEFVKWYVLRRIGSVGMLWNKSGGGWLGEYLNKKPIRQRFLDEYVDEGIIKTIEVEGIKEKFYIKAKDASLLDLSDPEQAMRFIAPLDNLIWDREMTAAIFDFDYKWEVYVPATKRKYGYYVLPVLCGNRFVARFEPEKHKTHLPIKNWWWEEGVKETKAMKNAKEQEMQRFAGCFGKAL